MPSSTRSAPPEHDARSPFPEAGQLPVSFFPAANVDHATELCRLAPPWHVRTAISLGHAAPVPVGRSAIPVGRMPMSELVTEIR